MINCRTDLGTKTAGSTNSTQKLKGSSPDSSRLKSPRPPSRTTDNSEKHRRNSKFRYQTWRTTRSV